MADDPPIPAQLQAQLATLMGVVTTLQQEHQMQATTITGLLQAAQQQENVIQQQTQTIQGQTVNLQLLQQQAAAQPLQTTFNVNPYAGNINPNSRNGEKMFLTATKHRDESDRIKPNHQNAKQFLKMMEKDAGTFAWGNITSNIRINAAGDTLNLLKDYQTLTLDQVRRSNRNTFSEQHAAYNDDLQPNAVVFNIDPANVPGDHQIFHARVRINMIGLRIIGSLTTKGFDTLNLNKSLYTWVDANGQVYYDGCVILYLILQHCNPSTRVGVSDLKQTIRQCTVSKFNHNVINMTDKMMECMNEIESRNLTHEDMVLDLFTALLTGKNEEFNQLIRSEKSKWEMGEVDHTPSDLVTLATLKYNNLVKQSLWTKSSEKDDKMVALTTKISELEKKLDSKKTGGGGGNGNQDRSSNYDKVATWRFKKNLGDHVENKDGKEWWWCPQHNDKKGLYVRHKPEDHGKPFVPKGSTSSTSTGGSNKSLTLNDKLKKAMVTKFKCSEAEATALMTSLN